MYGAKKTQPDSENEVWKYHLDRFTDEYQHQLAALSWGLHLQNPESQETLGLDLQPSPHFVFCSREALEILNRNTDNQLQEAIGLIDAHKPETEVLIIAIGAGQIKLLYFEPDVPPPTCFERSQETTEALIQQLETCLKTIMEKTGSR
ncbi:hypothetical protein [Spirulina sp. 06S082]|uniref:beta-carboxysome assembly chaperone CcmS n=1 Tax=Spirulina sp. 06S082 TaxID=3110248 RepID=UPI002B1F061B|nr:hypothetical protein [Spirulina sp. 06S082]MEA5468807.1 hypothetical protein [Spirulina sp. 06S082]